MKIISADDDTTTYVITPESEARLKAVLATTNPNGIDPEQEFSESVTILEDDSPKIYAARFTRHSGWGLKLKVDKYPTLFLEFCGSGNADA